MKIREQLDNGLLIRVSDITPAMWLQSIHNEAFGAEQRYTILRTDRHGNHVIDDNVTKDDFTEKAWKKIQVQTSGEETE